MKPTTTLLSFSMALLLAACGGSTSSDDSKNPASKTEQPSADKAPEKTEPAGDKTSEPAAAADNYVLAALGSLATGGPIAKAETTAYGCGVKYASEGGEPTAKVGEPAPAFTLPDTDGKQVSLSDFAGKTVVLEWFNPDCPFVKYAHGEGPLATMAAEQAKGEVVWLAINSGADGKQGAGAERSKQAAAEWKMEHPILIDADGAVGHAYGAKTTPHMYVIDTAGKLVYAGALDNAPLGRVGD